MPTPTSDKARILSALATLRAAGYVTATNIPSTGWACDTAGAITARVVAAGGSRGERARRTGEYGPIAMTTAALWRTIGPDGNLTEPIGFWWGGGDQDAVVAAFIAEGLAVRTLPHMWVEVVPTARPLIW